MNDFEKQFGYTQEEWAACLKVLQLLKEDPFQNPDNQFLGTLLTKISKKAKKQLSKKTEKKEEAISAIKKAVISKNALSGTTLYGEEYSSHKPTYTEVYDYRKCYSCFKPYDQIHSFYHRLCKKCAEFNFLRRFQKVDLSNRHVILTGGRVKIGYATALKLLRSNAHVTLTTRFPALAYESFSKEKDFALWKDRLVIYGLDLRMIKDVEAFVKYYVSTHKELDILINNAAQTIKYDESYNQKLLAAEFAASNLLPPLDMLPTKSPLLLKGEKYDQHLILDREYNRFGQPIDKREKNSWNSTLEEIDLTELLEVNLINQISPYILIKELLPLMKRSTFQDKFIINVTSSEGQFSYAKKTIFHPHTNMTKAALNMLTLTAARDLEKDGIYMNSVDVGWISTGARESLRIKQFLEGYIPPLDSVDGAARILHPIYEKLVNDVAYVGKLLKNYTVEDW